MQLMSGDQSGPVVELEGPHLPDGHVPFKVKTRALQRAHSMNTSTQSRPKRLKHDFNQAADEYEQMPLESDYGFTGLVY